MTQKLFEKNRTNLETILGEKLSTDLLGEKPAPDQINFIYEIVESLRGAYNDDGIKEWFYRERKQLEGKNPLKYLGRDWNPEDKYAQKVLELTRSLNK